MEIDPHRIKEIKALEGKSGPVFYWMIRDHRAEDNWALLFAQGHAIERKVPLVVVYCITDPPQDHSFRQRIFMIEGLREVEQKLLRYSIPFALLIGSAPETVARFIRKYKPSTLVTDFSPLRMHRQWQADLAEEVNAPFFEVDAHNIVPCRVTSDKQEYAAYTIRPKLRKLLPSFLTEFPRLRKHPYKWEIGLDANQWEKALALSPSKDIAPEISWIKPGGKAARRLLRKFLKDQLKSYDKLRNDPNESGQSNLSPYLHFGQISTQRVALEADKFTEDYASRDAFLEELIVRRELSDNFCLYCENYDSFDGFPKWAQTTLKEHSRDMRSYLYTFEQFEHAETHDDLWNAAQMEMVIRGKMHGYMRMYWAKKILEWSSTTKDALKTALYLNDKYELDGCDPNGYAGVAWSIGGVHDRAWSERDIFGKIRYMSYGGCKRKFDVGRYVARIDRLKEGV